VAVGVGLLLAYLIGLTYVAKQENLGEIRNLWPLAFLAAPFAAAWPTGSLAAAIYIGFVVWVLRAVLLVRARRIKPAVTSLIAGISLFDALQIANLGRADLAIAAVTMFGLTLAFQRVVPGT
jgi:4-hydroxybenzoate polyprenyltransferase